MNKPILVLALIFSMSVLVTSCKESKKETEIKTNQTELGVEKADLAMNDAFQCPMDCENGKTYDKEGKCPVCEMDLKKVEKEEGEERMKSG